MTPREYLQNKNVVVMGLGVFGGGVSSAKFCYKHGANVLVTDLRDATALKKSLNQFTKTERSHIDFVLGKHRKTDFKHADIVIVNPGVPRTSEYLQIAKECGAKFENDASLFFRFTTLPVIGVTGTRGKTTTVNWIAQLLSHHTELIEPIGNSSSNPLLSELSHESTKNLHVAELSSWQLEILPESRSAPNIAVITNIYPDHLNRYRGIKDYAGAKANIFKHQKVSDALVLNYDNEYRDFYSAKKPKSHVYFFSQKTLPKKRDGIFVKDGVVIFQKDGTQTKMVSIPTFEQTWGSHNVSNLLTAILAVHLYNPHLSISQKHVDTLTEVPYRQQTIYRTKHIHIINDSTSTSPDGLIAAIERFKSNSTVFIVGGTRKSLSFDDAAKIIKKYIQPQNIVLLSGSATADLIDSLRTKKYPLDDVKIHNTLKECVDEALSKKPSTLVFSPGAASFEKFKNEFDRADQFDKIIKTLFEKN